MDYLEYYKLSEHPFSNVVDSRFYYNSPQQSEAIVKLKYAIDTKKGLAVVIGNIGAGKTTLARRLLEQLDEETYEAVVLMDEVQMLNSREIMEEFRGLLNMESSEGKMVNFIFFGLPELDQVLSLDEPLKQRGAI